MVKLSQSLVFAVFALLLLGVASAHEVYVLTEGEIKSGFGTRGINVFDALNNPNSAKMFWTGFVLTALFFAVLSYLIHTKLSKKLDERFARMRQYAHLIIRVGFGISLAWGALHYCILGPELPISRMLGGDIWVPILFVTGLMLIFGVFTRIAALVSLVAFLTLTYQNGWYMMNYLNYLGEITVLLLEGADLFSLDKKLKWRSHIFHPNFPHWFAKLEELGHKYSFPILRVTFGVALIWAAMSVKILYPALSLDVLHNFGLDAREALPALFIVLVAGLLEIWLGLALVFGLLYRFHLAVIVVFVGYSVWFFGEAVWPHAILVGLGIGLFLHGKDRWMYEDNMFNVLWGWTKRFRKSKNPLTPE